MSKHSTRSKQSSRDVPRPDASREESGSSGPLEPPVDAPEAEMIDISDTDDASSLVQELQAELESAIAARQRAQADFVNFQRRSRENEARALRDGVAGLIRSLLPALDHIDLALDHDPDQITIEQLLDGIRMVRQEAMKALASHDVDVIDPEVGDEFDPSRHQAVLRQATDEQPPNTIVAVFQVGYAIQDVVLRPASVAVAGSKDQERGE